MGIYISKNLLFEVIRGKPLLEDAVNILEENVEVKELLEMSNVMAVRRLKFNDHGIVHARIVAGAALVLLDMLHEQGIEPSTLYDRSVRSFEEAELVTLIGAYLHDIGNAVHRVNHPLHGYILAIPILNDILPKVIGGRNLYRIRQEILHIIYSHDENIPCLTIEAGCVKVADGLDMCEGRARIPYKLGKADIHAFSALAIKHVEVSQGVERPIRINVVMSESAGIFQVEEVLMRKIRTSGLANLIEINVYCGERVYRIRPSGFRIVQTQL